MINPKLEAIIFFKAPIKNTISIKRLMSKAQYSTGICRAPKYPIIMAYSNHSISEITLISRKYCIFDLDYGTTGYKIEHYLTDFG